MKEFSSIKVGVISFNINRVECKLNNLKGFLRINSSF